MSKKQNNSTYQQYIQSIPTGYTDARGHSKFYISGSGATAIRNSISGLQNSDLFMFKDTPIPERLIIMGLFSQISPAKFELLVCESQSNKAKNKVIQDLVRTAAIIGVNGLLNFQDLRDAGEKSLKNFYNKMCNNSVSHNRTSMKIKEFYLDFYKNIATKLSNEEKEKLEAIDFVVLLQTPDYVHPQPVQQAFTQSDGRKEVHQDEVQENIEAASSEAEAETPKEFSINKVLQNIIIDLLKTVSVFVILTVVSFIFGALNSNFGSLVTNPFFAMICLSSSIILIMLTGGFKTFGSEDN